MDNPSGADPVAPFETETPRIDGFVVRDLIGTGGYSRVYRANQIEIGREVALKVLSVGLESDAQQRAFERECRAMGVLSQHPNIATVYRAAISSRRQPCIAMELYSGGTLGDRVRAGGPLAAAELLDVGIRIAGALQTAHDRGVVHRDIKPQNLFVSEYGQPALGDFGISSFDDDRTITGGGGGLTVHYAPPELIEGETATAQSDVYSLAATLYSLGSGERPFPRHEGQTLGELARRILVQPAPRLDGPEALADVLWRAMAKNPADRPDTALAFGQQLQAVQRDLALAETEMTLASKGTPAPRSLGLAVGVDDSRTVATTSVVEAVDGAATPSGSSVGPSALPSVGRRRWLLAAVSAACVALVAAALVSRPEEDPPRAERLTPSTIDEFFSVPATPTAVRVSAVEAGEQGGGGGEMVVVEWVASDGAVGYQVQLADSGAVVETSATEVELELGESSACVTVAAVGTDGKLSPPTPARCAD